MAVKKSKINDDAEATPHGALKVWWIPQIPGNPFEVRVHDIVEAALLMQVLADYDAFQLENMIKPDYSNAGGVMAFDTSDKTDGKIGSWVDWYSEDGEDFDEMAMNRGSLKDIRANPPGWEFA